MRSTKCRTGISFSNDLGASEMVHESRRDTSLMDSNSEFEFCISSRVEHEACSADELFFNGVIVPTQNRERFVPGKRIHQCERVSLLSSSSLPPLPPATTKENSKKEDIKEVMVVSSESEKKSQSKSFWGFSRSNSLRSYEPRKSSFCSLPLLSRSNSTGSVPTPKRTPLKDVKRQQSVLDGRSKSSFSSSLFSNSASNPYSKLKKPHSRKNHGNNLYISPILNVPPPYITKETADIYGLSSFLRSGKEKKSWR